MLNLFLFSCSSNCKSSKNEKLTNLETGDSLFGKFNNQKSIMDKDSDEIPENMRVKNVTGIPYDTSNFDIPYAKMKISQFKSIEFSPSLAKMKISDLLKLVSNYKRKLPVNLKKTDYQSFNFKLFEPIGRKILDSSIYYSIYKNDLNQIVKIIQHRSHSYDFKFLIYELNEYKIIDIVSMDEETGFGKKETVMHNGFIFKENNSNNLFYVGVPNHSINNINLVHNIMELDSFLFPLKQYKRGWPNDRIYNTEFIYKGNFAICEVSKKTGGFRLTENTTFGEIFNLFNTKVDKDHVYILVPGMLDDRRHIPHWYYQDYRYMEEFEIKM